MATKIKIYKSNIHKGSRRSLQQKLENVDEIN